MEQRTSAVRCAAFSAGMSRHPWLRSLFSIHWSKQSCTEKTHDNNALIQHSNRGPHYPSIKATERLIEVGNVPSMGIVGASLDNTLAKCVIGLFKTEAISQIGPRDSMREVERETLKWVD